MPKEEEYDEETAPELLEEAPADETEEAQPASTDWIKYVGTADQRVITGQDWRAAGVLKEDAEDAEPYPDVRWHAGNGYVVNRDELSFLTDEQFDQLIRGDRGFRVESSE